MKGTIVGSYRILDALSVGGMGTVYRAEHTLIGRLAAVKILHPELCANRDIVNRFFNEAKATTSIKHPGIVEVFDFGYLPSGHAYLIMELLEGESLASRLRRLGGRVGLAFTLQTTWQIAGALAAAHAKGIVHRDLKPDNLMLVRDPIAPGGERVKILDALVAKMKTHRDEIASLIALEAGKPIRDAEVEADPRPSNVLSPVREAEIPRR